MGRVEELEEALKKATPGPWECRREDTDTWEVSRVLGGVIADDIGPNNAALIVAAVNALSDLVELAKAVRECRDLTMRGNQMVCTQRLLDALARLDGGGGE